MSGNRIPTIPASIARLAALEDFAIDNNRLTSVPEELCSLSLLKTLNLRHALACRAAPVGLLRCLGRASLPTFEYRRLVPLV